MTAQQIAYFKALEEKRHNLVTEQLQERGQGETERHNYAVEQESARHNTVDEGIRANTNFINQGHYQNQDAVAYQNAQTNREHYERQDAMTRKHYVNMDSIAAYEHDMNYAKTAADIEKINSEIKVNEEKAFNQHVENLISAYDFPRKVRESAIDNTYLPLMKAFGLYQTGASYAKDVAGIINSLRGAAKDITGTGAFKDIMSMLTTK